jgi:lysophospholipase L1-like esterase
MQRFALRRWQCLFLGLSLQSALAGSIVYADESGPDAPLPGRVRLLLPPVVSAVEGLETNLYFDNVTLTLNPANYAFDVTCPRGQQQSERWTWTPAAGEAGEYPLRVEVRDEDNALVARGSTVVRVAPAAAGEGGGATMLMVGDSLTHASIYPARVLELCHPPGNPRLTLIGSHVPAGAAEGVRHEGYGGWTAQRFATHFTGIAREGDYGQRGSPFLYREGDQPPRLNFDRYADDVADGQIPGYVTIFLGPNDVYSLNDETIEAGIDTMLTHCDELIAAIHSAAPGTTVGMMPPVPPTASQDAFGSNYGNDQTRVQYKRNVHRVVERMLERYTGRDEERISIVTAFVNLDCQRGYPTTIAPYNARTTEEGSRQSNAVHPSTAGYNQIGDAVYAWLKAELSHETAGR